MSPSRHRSGVNIPNSVGNIPALSPIQGSPNKGTGSADPQGAGAGGDPKALMQWENTSIGKAVTVPENLSGFQEGERNRDLQLVSGRNVVLNYGSGAFDRSSKLHTYLPISNNPVSILLCLRFYVIFCFGQSSHVCMKIPPLLIWSISSIYICLCRSTLLL